LTDKLEEIVESLRMTSTGPDQYYKVVKGDTLTKIANKFNTTIEKIVSKNSSIYPSITNNFINVGWILKI
jgi:LysM repeat protein